MLNGYKTIIGLILWGFGSALVPYYPDVAGHVVQAGGLLAGIGAAHKVMKGGIQ